MTARQERVADDSGFTLVELLVAMTIVIALLTISTSTLVASNSAVATTRKVQGLNEEARQALNRIARDVRQASAIVTAVNPDRPTFEPGSIVALSFRSDFDGDGCIAGVTPTVQPPGFTGCKAYNSLNPEDVTYCFAPSTAQLYVIDNNATGVTPVTATSTSCSGGQPLLAGDVFAFKISYRSNVYRDDVDPSDGVTTWRELDSAGPPDGNNNGQLDTVELGNVDSVVFELTMRSGGHQQVYRTQVDLRNRSL